MGFGLLVDEEEVFWPRRCLQDGDEDDRVEVCAATVALPPSIFAAAPDCVAAGSWERVT